MIVTMMRMIEVATTTLIITIVGSEEGTAISVTLPNVVSVVIVVIFSVVGVVFTVLFIAVLVGVGELAIVELVVSGVMMVSGEQVEPLA